MKLKTAIFSIAVVTASVANAQSSADSVRAQLTEMGYSNIEIQRSGTTYTVEAYRDGQKRELRYNAETGEILSDRMYRDSSNDRSSSNGRSNDESNDRSSNDESNDRSSNDESNDRSSNDESDDRSSNDESDDRSNDEGDDD